MAHVVVYEGKKYNLSIAKISADRLSVEIYPFAAEECGVSFVNGTVHVVRDADGLLYFSFLGREL